ncbi:hypothetical protein BJQ90_03649 [Arthrobacter sp. SO3]|nr:hypothetical protein [Arthrobacter sp. SO3]MCB5294186.1 hypothetical protein [Arthrobacter sp. SO3]
MKNGVLPDRGGSAEAPKNAIPACVVSVLLGTIHLPEEEVKASTAAGTLARTGELSKPPPDDGDAEADKVQENVARQRFYSAGRLSRTSISGWCFLTHSAIRWFRFSRNSGTLPRYSTYSGVDVGVP